MGKQYFSALNTVEEIIKIGCYERLRRSVVDGSVVDSLDNRSIVMRAVILKHIFYFEILCSIRF